MKSRLLTALLPLSLISAGNMHAQATLPKDIFTPPASATMATAPAETIEFAGVTTIAKKTDVVIVDKAAKKSRTIAVGETVDGIQVLRYDADKDQVVVKINGAQKTLTLRRGSGPTNAPAPVAVMHTGFNVAPASTPPPNALSFGPGDTVFTRTSTVPAVAQPVPAPAPTPAQPTGPATPETVQKQELEARMLVSDLLEIGMAQRKAYEEAQRRSQENANTPAAPALPAQPAPK